ncbi:hypothetical protein [Mesorhizobium sp. CA5]|uniref:hypothetical protein n=1 Tax=Mesorhizobium sp. CA5 TaxID=2876638 RepID=UPI001CD0E8F0|nr:hypothetical protein [Mesorhizobium sp. CA5]MBZ9841232.1 hypothetical protein [Mesorhizobium sp. CA5]
MPTGNEANDAKDAVKLRLIYFANRLIYLLFLKFVYCQPHCSSAWLQPRDRPPRKEGFPMMRGFSNRLRDDSHCKVQQALRIDGIVNIIRVAEEIRLKNLAENIAREDIESLVMQIAQLYGAPIEFDDQALTALDLPEATGGDNRNDLERALWEHALPDARLDLLQLDE